MPTLKWLWHSKIMKNDDEAKEGMPRTKMHLKKKKNHPEDTYQAKHTATHKGLPTVLIACHGVKPVAQISPVNLDCSSLFSSVLPRRLTRPRHWDARAFHTTLRNKRRVNK